MTYIGNPPAECILPVTKGADREFTLLRKDTDGNPANWGATLSIAVDIDKADPTVVDAVVTGDAAVIKLESEVCDQVKNSTRWRVIMASGETETAVIVGTFERHDG